MVLIATKPIGARELNKMELGGKTLADDLANPNSVIVRGVDDIVFEFKPDKSLGVAHETSPFQYSATVDFGVPPLTILVHSPNATRSQFTPTSPQELSGLW